MRRSFTRWLTMWFATWLAVFVSIAPVSAIAQTNAAGSRIESKTESAVGQSSEGAKDLTPHDAPFIFEPHNIVVPPVPESFQHRDIGWMRLSYPPGLYRWAEELRAAAEDTKFDLASALGQPVLSRIEVRLARTPEEMAQLAPKDMPPPSYATGVAYSGLHLVLVSAQAPSGELSNIPETFKHELAHVALEDAVLGHHVPRWFNEGLAIYLAGENYIERIEKLGGAALTKRLMPLSELDRAFPNDHYEVSMAYAQSADFVRYLLRSSDRARFASLIERVRAGAPFERAIGDAYATDLRKLEFEWREDVAKRYGFLPILTGGSLIWVVAFVLLAYGYLRKRRESKAKLAQWEREEAEMDALREQAEIIAVDAPGTAPEIARRAGTVIEHDGRWYTLH